MKDTENKIEKLTKIANYYIDILNNSSNYKAADAVKEFFEITKFYLQDQNENGVK